MQTVRDRKVDRASFLLGGASFAGAATLAGCGSTAQSLFPGTGGGALTTARTMKEAVAPQTSTPSPIKVANGKQIVEITFSGTSFTMTTTDANGNNTTSVLTASVNTATQVITYSPLGNSPTSLNYGSYTGTPISAYGGTVTPASDGQGGTYSHPAGSGSVQYLTSSSQVSGYLGSVNSLQTVPAGAGKGGCQGTKSCPLISGNGWINAGVGMLGIVAAIVGILATGVLAFAAGIVALAIAVILLFESL